MPTVESRVTRAVARLLVLPLAVISTMAVTTAQALAADGDSARPAEQAVTALPAQVAADARGLADKVAQFNAAHAEADASTAERLVTAVRREVNAGRLSVHLPDGAGIVAGEATVWRDQAGGHLVHLPYAGSVVAPSGLTVVFDAQGNRRGALEQVYQEQTATSGTVAVWADGALKKSVLVDAAGTVSARGTAPQAAAPTDVVAAGWWDRFTACLNRMGVPSWVITGIAIACAAICVASAGTACVICIAGVAAGYSWVISYCIDQAT